MKAIKDTLRLMAEAARPLATREEVMREFFWSGGGDEALLRHYYPIAMKKGLEKAHLLGDETLDLIQEVAYHILVTLKAWRSGRRELPSGKWITFWVEVEADRAVREWFYRSRGIGYRSSRLVATLKRTVARLQADLGREPRPEEIAEELGVPQEVVVEALALAEAEEILSLDDHTEEGTPYREFLAQEDAHDAFEFLEEAIERYRLRQRLGAEEVDAFLNAFLNGEALEEEQLAQLEKALKQAMTQTQAV
ncbi:sigma-70 domain-containing protein [Thermus caldifontis]|uniref:sigma-70 domain-containing protein n=1 Tax=Thermus caldifontis TaxID=1930763 RepID=UPI000DF15DB8|nr:sigma-70 domain-containing protein [Thermus caldifontis]